MRKLIHMFIVKITVIYSHVNLFINLKNHLASNIQTIIGKFFMIITYLYEVLK